MKDLSRDLFSDKKFFSDNRNQELKELLQEFRKLKPTDEDFYSIENVTTTIFSKKIFRDFYEEERYKRMENQILRFIHQKLRGRKTDPENEDILVDFLDHCFKKPLTENNNQNLIITFNYDLLLEYILKKHRSTLELETYYGVKLRRYSRPTEPETRYRLEILKLHGSFNWFVAKGSSDRNITSIYQVDPEDRDYFIHENDVPVFIPMSHGKEFYLTGTLYNTLWVKASYYLEKAEEIYFIGYGFPASDINNLLFFGKHKNKIRKVVVHYKNDVDANLVRLKELLGKERVLSSDAKIFLSENLDIF